MQATLPQSTALSLHPQVVALQQELKDLRAQSAKLFAQAEYMQFEERPMLISLYQNAIGTLQYEELKLTIQIQLANLEISLIQSYINHNAPIDQERINTKIKTAQEEYKARLEQKEAELKAAENFLNSPALSQEETTELRDLYRMLAKALHPDLNPNQTPEEHDLFLKAVSAYRLGDLHVLRQIALALESQQAIEIPQDDIQTLIEKIRESIAVFQERIDLMNAQFPFLFREQILNPEWIREQQVELTERINKAKARLQELKNYIMMLKLWKPASSS